MNIELLIMIGTLISAMAAAAAACIAGKSLKETRESTISENLRHCRERTLKDYERLESNVVSKIYEYKKEQIDQIKNDIGSAENKKLAHYLELCELFAIGIEEGVYDKAILSKLELKHLYREFIKVYPFIVARRRISHDDDYEYLEKVMDSIGQKFPYMQREMH